MVRPLESKTVLIVDDSVTNRELSEAVLAPLGCRLILARDGREAIALARTHEPDLVILDIRMPIIDGYGVVLELRNLRRSNGICIVAFTACAMEGDRERALSNGFDGFITKPVAIASLREQVSGYLERQERKAMTKAQLTNRKNNVQSKHRLLLQKLEEIAGLAPHRQDLKIDSVPDPLDQLIASADREVAVSQLQGSSRVLRDVLAAIRRIEDGSYGICAQCETPIPEKRLAALPWAAMCVHCQTHEESQVGTSPDSMMAVA